MITDLKTILGITDASKDTLLQLIINRCIDEARIYTNNKDIHSLRNAILQMCVYQYNRLKTEGVDVENYSGVSFNYSQDYPESVLRQLKSLRRIGVIYDK